MEGKTREGFLYGLVAYGWWGLVPLYFRWLRQVDPWEQLAHRILWSLFFLLLLQTWMRRLGSLRTCLTNKRLLAGLACSSLLVATNWFFYILSVVTEKVVHASLGYFLLPLVSVALARLFFGERLRRLQILALALAACGVGGFAWTIGGIPWIALVLAISFSFYGVLRKKIPVDGLVGLTLEASFLAPLALGYLVFQASRSQLVLGSAGPGTDLLLTASGIVTAVPLVCFAQAARRLPLSTLGFMQYISPSIQFLVAVLVFGEDFDLARLRSFLFIWAGLVLFTWDSYAAFRRQRRAMAGELADEE